MKLSEWLGLERGRGLALAKAIGVSPVLVSQWSTGPREPPVERCVPIERFTGGAVTCEELRPDKTADFAYLRSAGPVGAALATIAPQVAEIATAAAATAAHVVDQVIEPAGVA